MHITFFGVRGSVPTPGESTVRYGGNTVCVEVRLADGTLIVLDGGTGIRGLGNKLVREGFRGPIHLLVTHLHWDHIIGTPFFGPLYRPETQMVFYPLTPERYAYSHDPSVFQQAHFPVRFSDLPAKIERADTTPAELRIGSGRVRRIALNHPGGAFGFRIDDDDGASLCYLTDNELNPPGETTTPPAELARFAAGCGVMIHDAQYLPADMPAKHGWGHSLVPEVLELGRQAETRTCVLFHHDPDRDDAALDKIGQDAETWARVEAPAMSTLVAREGQSLDITP